MPSKQNEPQPRGNQTRALSAIQAGNYEESLRELAERISAPRKRGRPQ